MTAEQKTDAPKKLTITLTDRPPVKITEDDWPIVAEAKYSHHDGQVECQANRRTLGWLKVRQHADGRTIVYGHYSYYTAWRGEAGANHRDGQMLTPTAEEYPEAAHASYWTGPRIIEAIREVGSRLGERSEHQCWTDVIADTIADMPAEELA